jgi:hypothetical protein
MYCNWWKVEPENLTYFPNLKNLCTCVTGGKYVSFNWQVISVKKNKSIKYQIFAILWSFLFWWVPLSSFWLKIVQFSLQNIQPRNKYFHGLSNEWHFHTMVSLVKIANGTLCCCVPMGGCVVTQSAVGGCLSQIALRNTTEYPSAPVLQDHPSEYPSNSTGHP